eukprot:9129903-Pyramimonas_sp.AAC.1
MLRTTRSPNVTPMSVRCPKLDASLTARALFIYCSSTDRRYVSFVLVRNRTRDSLASGPANSQSDNVRWGARRRYGADQSDPVCSDPEPADHCSRWLTMFAVGAGSGRAASAT